MPTHPSRFLVLLPAAFLVAAPAQAAPAAQESALGEVEKQRLAIMTAAGPHWKPMCELIEAILHAELRSAFLDRHRSLSDRFPSLDNFTQLAEQWRSRVRSLPARIQNLDWERTGLQHLESQNGTSIVVVQQEPGSERIVRIKGVFSGEDLVDVSILGGIRVKAPIKGAAASRTWYR